MLAPGTDPSSGKQAGRKLVPNEPHLVVSDTGRLTDVRETNTHPGQSYLLRSCRPPGTPPYSGHEAARIAETTGAAFQVVSAICEAPGGGFRNESLDRSGFRKFYMKQLF